jgi:hypothetical protein
MGNASQRVSGEVFRRAQPRLVVIKDACLIALHLLNQLYGAVGFNRLIAERVDLR